VTSSKKSKSVPSQRWRRGILPVLLGAPFFFWLFAIRQPATDLETREIDVSQWEARFGHRYRWFSEREILFQKRDLEGRHSLFVFDSGAKEPQPEPTLLMAGGKAPMDVLSVSPQSKYVLYRRDLQTDLVSCFSTADHSTRPWSATVADAYLWFPDAAHVWEFDTETSKIGIRSAMEPDHFHPAVFTKASPLNHVPFNIGGVCLTRNGHYWLDQESWKSLPLKAATLVEGEIGKPNAPGKQHIVKLPIGDGWASKIRCMAFSPNGDHIAWFLFNRRVLPIQRLFERLVGVAEREPSPWAHSELWISNVDGTQMHLIGALPRGTEAPTELTWSPTGNRLAFVQGDRLYTLLVRSENGAYRWQW